MDLKDFFCPLLEKFNIELDLQLHDEGAILIKGHRERFEQTMVNIIHNAIDAMEKIETKKLKIKTYLDKNTFRVEIIDTGSGIGKDIQHQIYDPFFTTKEPNKGSGLGLTLVRSYMDDYKGNIKLTSNDDGSNFLLTFDIAVEEFENFEEEKKQLAG